MLTVLTTPWVLDCDTTIKPLYGRQEGAVVSYNPKKPGRPSHACHAFLMAGTRLILDVDVAQQIGIRASELWRLRAPSGGAERCGAAARSTAAE